MQQGTETGQFGQASDSQAVYQVPRLRTVSRHTSQEPVARRVGSEPPSWVPVHPHQAHADPRSSNMAAEQPGAHPQHDVYGNEQQQGYDYYGGGGAFRPSGDAEQGDTGYYEHGMGQDDEFKSDYQDGFVVPQDVEGLYSTNSANHSQQDFGPMAGIAGDVQYGGHDFA